MKTLKKIGQALLIIIVAILFVALFVPREFNYEKSISINAPIDSVWGKVNSLSALDKWSPWNDHDANMKKSMTGVDGTIGTVQSWESEIVGNGSQTISKIEKPTLFITKLDFHKPRESHGKAYVKLVSEGNTTKVTWGMTSKMPYPINIMIPFMNMEKNWEKTGITDFRN